MVAIAGALVLANPASDKGQKLQVSQGPIDSEEVVLDEFTKARLRPEAAPWRRNRLPPLSKQPKYRRARTLPAGRSALPATSPELGITVWQLRPSRPTDRGPRLQNEDRRESSQLTPVRMQANTKFRANDRLRITIESPQPGYLYVVDRQQHADGSLGDTYLVFPTKVRRDNRVGPGRLIDLPAQEDRPGYFTILPSANFAELFTFIVLPRPLDYFPDDGMKVNNLSMLANLADQLSDGVERFEMVGSAGNAWTDEERMASADSSLRRLTPDEPAPQIVYRIPRGNDNAPVVVTMAIHYEPPSPESLLKEMFPDLVPYGARPQSGGLREKLGTFKSPNDTLHRAAEALIEEKRYDEARMAMDLAKREELLDYLRRDSTKAGSLRTDTATAALQQSIADNGRRHHPLFQEKSWEEQYSELSDRIAEIIVERRRLLQNERPNGVDTKKLDQLDESLGKAGQAYNLFVAKLFEGSNAGEVAKLAKLQDGPALMEDLRRLNDETQSETIVIYTIVGEKKYTALIITADAPLVREYAIPRVQLRETVERFRQVLQSPRFDPLPRAQELYRYLVEPIRRDIDKLGARTLLWVLDDTLRYLPIAALHDGKGYLVQRFQNVIITPASNGRLHPEPNPNPRALGFGVSETADGRSTLPAVKDELREIIADEDSSASQGSVLRGKVFLNGDFTETRLKATLRLRKYSIVHIASHFTFKPGNNTNSQLLIGEDSYLTPALLFAPPNIFAKVDLLVLSACETALGGPDAEGREIESFGVLAQSAGASAVMATLWRVADSSTKDLMIDFYRGNQPHLNKAERLRRAQLALLKREDKREASPTPERSSERVNDKKSSDAMQPFVLDPNAKYSHPYYWAPFVLIGNWK